MKWPEHQQGGVSSASDKWEMEVETEIGKPNLKGCMEGNAVAFSD